MTELELGPQETLFTAGCDIQDCFYAAKMPDGLEQFFCLHQNLSADEVYRVFGDDVDLDRFSGVYVPCVNVLPMGFSWSFYIIQQLHEQATMRAPNSDASRLIIKMAIQLRQFQENRWLCLTATMCIAWLLAGKRPGWQSRRLNSSRWDSRCVKMKSPRNIFKHLGVSLMGPVESSCLHQHELGIAFWRLSLYFITGCPPNWRNNW